MEEDEEVDGAEKDSSADAGKVLYTKTSTITANNNHPTTTTFFNICLTLLSVVLDHLFPKQSFNYVKVNRTFQNNF